MKKIISWLLICNFAWGAFFVVLQGAILLGVNTDGRFNAVMIKTDYIEKGGNPFDYYAGYLFFSANDNPERAPITYDDTYKPKFDITGITFWRFFCFVAYICLWFFGFASLIKINECDPEKPKIKNMYKRYTYKFYRYTTALITTAISMYGIYYTIVYCGNFWLE